MLPMGRALSMLLPAPYICAIIAHMYEFSKRDHTVICLPISITRSSLFWYTFVLFPGAPSGTQRCCAPNYGWNPMGRLGYGAAIGDRIATVGTIIPAIIPTPMRPAPVPTFLPPPLSPSRRRAPTGGTRWVWGTASSEIHHRLGEAAPHPFLASERTECHDQ